MLCACLSAWLLRRQKCIHYDEDEMHADTENALFQCRPKRRRDCAIH